MYIYIYNMYMIRTIVQQPSILMPHPVAAAMQEWLRILEHRFRWCPELGVLAPGSMLHSAVFVAVETAVST